MIIHLDFGSEVPIYLQIRNAVVKGIADGSLVEGEKLPTIRALADEAGINMMTVNKAYRQLKEEGYIYTDRRNGAMVCPRRESGSDEPPEQIREPILLAASEAKLAGMTKEAFLQFCCGIFEGLEEEK